MDKRFYWPVSSAVAISFGMTFAPPQFTPCYQPSALACEGPVRDVSAALDPSSTAENGIAGNVQGEPVRESLYRSLATTGEGRLYSEIFTPSTGSSTGRL